jgi:hypothetical protein
LIFFGGKLFIFFLKKSQKKRFPYFFKKIIQGNFLTKVPDPFLEKRFSMLFSIKKKSFRQSKKIPEFNLEKSSKFFPEKIFPMYFFWKKKFLIIFLKKNISLSNLSFVNRIWISRMLDKVIQKTPNMDLVHINRLK